MTPATVIFACVHSAGRSQMAAAFFNTLADPARARAIAAGTEPAVRVHPEVVATMREVGIDLSAATPALLTSDLARGAALLVTMGCGESCPYVPGLERIDWGLADPKGKSSERVRAIRDDVRASVFYATGLIGFFYLMTFILGFGAMVLVGPDTVRAADAGGNMAAPLLAALLGGKPLLGFIAAVAFATILAVVAGLTLSGAAALSHDLWVNVFRAGHADAREQLVVARIATVVLGIVAVALGIAFKGQNVAFMVSLAFAIAASSNFPALVLSIFWPRCTTSGAVASMAVGTLATLVLIALSPTVQVDLLRQPSAWFALKNAALVTIPLSFAAGIVVSLLRPEPGGLARYAVLARQAHFGHADEAGR